MEFHQLRYFIAAAEHLNMSRAAEQVHISQPALSRQIALLEDELGLLLFERIRKRIHLTPAGAFFLEKARLLLEERAAAIQAVRERFGAARKEIGLGFIGPFLDDLVTPVVREFQQRHPHIKVRLSEMPPNEQVRQLLDQRIDIGILANLSDKDRKAVSVQALSSHRIDAVLPVDHELADRKSISLASLGSDPWVSLSNVSFPGRREFLLECCGKAGFKPRVVSEPETLPLMLAAIATGLGVGLSPRHASKIPHAGCVFVPLSSPRILTRLMAVTRKEGGDQALGALVALLQEQAVSV